jgi:GT2 family glycosyltransferase
MNLDISVVIPSLEGDPMTLESIPDGVETEVVVGEPRPVARNLGAERTSGDVLVFCDDDISFEEEFFWKQINATAEGSITGLADWDFGYLITRFMVVHRSDFESLDGFDTRLNYMEDTELCLNAISRGMSLRSLPRDSVYHEEHDSVGKNRAVLVKNTLYLARKYPRYGPHLLKSMLL